MITLRDRRGCGAYVKSSSGSSPAATTFNCGAGTVYSPYRSFGEDQALSFLSERDLLSHPAAGKTSTRHVSVPTTEARPSCSCNARRPQLTSAGEPSVTNKKPGGKSTTVAVLVEPHLQGRTGQDRAVSLTAFRASDATMKLLACFEPPYTIWLPSILYRTSPLCILFRGICRDLCDLTQGPQSNCRSVDQLDSTKHRFATQVLYPVESGTLCRCPGQRAHPLLVPLVTNFSP